MVDKAAKSTVCPICHEEQGANYMVHMLVAHGPLVPDAKKRRKTRKMLSRLHRRIEERGFSEADAHIIIKMVGEELRGLGLI